MSETASSLARAARPLVLAPALPLLLTACGSSGSDPASGWSGTMDTLSSGEVVVRNTGDPLWTPEERWRVVEDLRIGSVATDGPDLFGGIRSFDIDAWGRIFILDGQAQEIRLFDSEGAFVRKFGRRGEGPGEFASAVQVDLGRDGEVWVMDPPQAHVSIFDTSGAYLRERRTETATGLFLSLYDAGGFDRLGRYRVEISDGAVIRFDSSFTPMDTIVEPEDPVERDHFTLRSGSGGMWTLLAPFQGGQLWRFSPSGTTWTLLTRRYELTERTTGGKVLRRVTRDHEPPPVTAADREEVRKDFEWFTERGGKIDWSRVPQSKPPTISFFLDDEGNLWVERQAADSEDEGRLFDLFDAEGRHLGTLPLPFSLVGSIPQPVVRKGVLHGVSRDELGVSHLVRARIEKP